MVIRLPIHNITVTLAGKGGTITSDLKHGEPSSPEDEGYFAAVDAVECMILAHVCAGIDVTDPKYVGGVQTALDKIAMNYL
jgi:hypothetical protein